MTLSMYVLLLLQMVMEFTDNVMNLDSHQINSSEMKQFVEVSEYCQHPSHEEGRRFVCIRDVTH